MVQSYETEQVPNDSHGDSQLQAPGILDVIRFFYNSRAKLSFLSFTMFGLGALIFLYSYLTAPKMVAGILGLTFTGIVKGEYPSGKKFSVEDFRSPSLLTQALEDAGISNQAISIPDLAAHTYITPVVPVDIQNRWQKQDQAGQQREAYSPTEFEIAIQLNRLTDQQSVRLFDALVQRYQEGVRVELNLARGFVYPAEIDYDKLAGVYDRWDIPTIFREYYKSLTEKLDDLAADSLAYQDATYQLKCRELAKDLATWERTRLQPVEALTYQGTLVSNRELVKRRIQYRIQELDIQISHKSEIAKAAMRLLEDLDGPRAFMARQTTAGTTVPFVDTDALERLLKSDYLGPVVVERVSRAQDDIETEQQEKARLENQLGWLSKGSGTGVGTASAEYRDLTSTLSRELNGVVQRYNQLLEDYLKAKVASLVVVRRVPIVTRVSFSPVPVLVGIAMISVFLSIVLLGLVQLFRSARDKDLQERADKQREVAHR